MPAGAAVRGGRRKAKAGRGGRRRRPSGYFSVATYNIRDGRQEGLYSAARALNKANVNVAVVQETKIMDPEFATRKWAGYDIKVAASGSASWRGGGLTGKRQGGRD